MKPYPELRTDRLVLRGFAPEDALDVQRLAGEWDVARTLLVVPHPYEDGMAEEWIATYGPAHEAGELESASVPIHRYCWLQCSTKSSGKLVELVEPHWDAPTVPLTSPGP